MSNTFSAAPLPLTIGRANDPTKFYNTLDNGAVEVRLATGVFPVQDSNIFGANQLRVIAVGTTNHVASASADDITLFTLEPYAAIDTRSTETIPLHRVGDDF